MIDDDEKLFTPPWPAHWPARGTDALDAATRKRWSGKDMRATKAAGWFDRPDPALPPPEDRPALPEPDLDEIIQVRGPDGKLLIEIIAAKTEDPPAT